MPTRTTKHNDPTKYNKNSKVYQSNLIQMRNTLKLLYNNDFGQREIIMNDFYAFYNWVKYSVEENNRNI